MLTASVSSFVYIYFILIFFPIFLLFCYPIADIGDFLICGNVSFILNKLVYFTFFIYILAFIMRMTGSHIFNFAFSDFI